jgi:DNA-directed RNA polymerase subunit RPC12/RpoP
LTIAVAPILGLLEAAWEKGKYNPKSKIPVSKQEVIVKRMDISVDLNRLIRQVKDGGIVVVYRCPHCGGKLKVGRDATVESLKVCEYCGTEIEAMELADFLRTALS